LVDRWIEAIAKIVVREAEINLIKVGEEMGISERIQILEEGLIIKVDSKEEVVEVEEGVEEVIEVVSDSKDPEVVEIEVLWNASSAKVKVICRRIAQTKASKRSQVKIQDHLRQQNRLIRCHKMSSLIIDESIFEF